ncbi:type II toxin-antitoxin system RelE/ParE family toxin [Pseudomonas sp. P9_35]|nr:type II toxin-antitoxin system RelE/ParE family toxin [Pseudomonas sp. P9_32]WPN67174.1 type II toxin-antitoxin system RelE/ParE family toxin [Pseudomonas sp. P9_35]
MATIGTMINKKINEIHQTSYFEDWLDSVKDAQGKSAILARLDRAADGNFGDCEPVGDGVSEMRVFIGPGYRIYFVRSGIAEYLMLSGSDKTDQKRGIKKAKAILDALRGK